MMAKTQMSPGVDPALIRKVQKELRARTNTEVVERSLVTVLELAKHHRMTRRFSGRGKPYDFRAS